MLSAQSPTQCSDTAPSEARGERAHSHRSTSEAWTQTRAKSSHGHLPKPLPEDSVRKKMHAPPGTWEPGACVLPGSKQGAQAEGILARYPEPRRALPGNALLSRGLGLSNEEMMGVEQTSRGQPGSGHCSLNLDPRVPGLGDGDGCFLAKEFISPVRSGSPAHQSPLLEADLAYKGPEKSCGRAPFNECSPEFF